MTLLDCSFPLPSQTVFERTVARDWYDGLTSGIVKSSLLEKAFSFDVLAWGPSQAKRVFALSSLDIDAFDRIVELLQHKGAAKWPIWFPEWPMWRSKETAEAFEITQLLEKAEHPQYVIASDSMFTTLLAARELDRSSKEHLPITFDDSPAEDDFLYWRGFLRLTDQ